MCGLSESQIRRIKGLRGLEANPLNPTPDFIGMYHLSGRRLAERSGLAKRRKRRNLLAPVGWHVQIV